MKNKQGNVAMIAIIVVIVAITAGIAGWMFAKKSQMSPTQTVATQPITTQSQPVVQSAKPEQQSATSSTQTNEFASWKTYANDKYGFEIKYPSDAILAPEKYADKTYVSTIKIGDIATAMVLSKANLPINPVRCADKKTLVEQVKCNYLVLENNADKISTQKFGDNTFVYADFEAIDHPNVKNRMIWVFIEKDDYIYEFEAVSPSSSNEDLFKKILSTFKFTK